VIYIDRSILTLARLIGNRAQVHNPP